MTRNRSLLFLELGSNSFKASLLPKDASNRLSKCSDPPRRRLTNLLSLELRTADASVCSGVLSLLQLLRPVPLREPVVELDVLDDIQTPNDQSLQSAARVLQKGPSR